jgi:hypothetical protein
MKTFRQYIQEANESFDLDKFKKDCDFFLTKLKGTHGKDLLYHGAVKPWPLGQGYKACFLTCSNSTY